MCTPLLPCIARRRRPPSCRCVLQLPRPRWIQWSASPSAPLSMPSWAAAASTRYPHEGWSWPLLEAALASCSRWWDGCSRRWLGSACAAAARPTCRMCGLLALPSYPVKFYYSSTPSSLVSTCPGRMKAPPPVLHYALQLWQVELLLREPPGTAAIS